MPDPSLLLWDIGGVLLSNGWDREGRRAAAERFGLDPDELEGAHERLASALETGKMDWTTYLERTVFDVPRSFPASEFHQFVWDRSTAHEPALRAARELRAHGRYTMAALNNESRELNEYRVERFRLSEIFHVFFSSCDTGLRKPDPEAFRFALRLTRQAPAQTLFLDDRAENVATADRLGLRTILVRDPDRLPEDLLAAGISTD